MPDALGSAVAVLSLLLALTAAVYVVLDRLTDRWLLGLAGVLEAALVGHLAVGLAVLGDRAEGASAPVFVAYLIGLLVLLPVSAVWALGEPSRAGTAVWIVAGLVVPVLLLRVGQVYAGA